MNNDCRSPSTRVLGALAVVFSIVISPAPLRAQHHRVHVAARTTLDGAKIPNAFATGDSVEVEYFRKGDWLPARVTDVVNDGYAYTVDLVPYGDGKIVNAQIHYSRVRAHVADALTVVQASSGVASAGEPWPAPPTALPAVGVIPPAAAPPGTTPITVMAATTVVAAMTDSCAETVRWRGESDFGGRESIALRSDESRAPLEGARWRWRRYDFVTDAVGKPESWTLSGGKRSVCSPR